MHITWCRRGAVRHHHGETFGHAHAVERMPTWDSDETITEPQRFVAYGAHLLLVLWLLLFGSNRRSPSRTDRIVLVGHTEAVSRIQIGADGIRSGTKFRGCLAQLRAQQFRVSRGLFVKELLGHTSQVPVSVVKTFKAAGKRVVRGGERRHDPQETEGRRSAARARRENFRIKEAGGCGGACTRGGARGGTRGRRGYERRRGRGGTMRLETAAFRRVLESWVLVYL